MKNDNLTHANNLKDRYNQMRLDGYGKNTASKEALSRCNHSGGFEKDEYGEVLLAYCGEYVVLFSFTEATVYKKVDFV